MHLQNISERPLIFKIENESPTPTLSPPCMSPTRWSLFLIFGFLCLSTQKIERQGTAIYYSPPTNSHSPRASQSLFWQHRSTLYYLVSQEYLRRRVATWRLSRGLGRADRRIHPVMEWKTRCWSVKKNTFENNHVTLTWTIVPFIISLLTEKPYTSIGGWKSKVGILTWHAFVVT